MTRFLFLSLLFLFSQSSWASCQLSDIEIKSMKAKFVDPCKTMSCATLKGVAVLTNRCNEPVGVQIKITGYDKSGSPLATRDLWPASIRNIPPGDYTFSLDTWLDYEPEMKSFELEIISIKHWQ